MDLQTSDNEKAKKPDSVLHRYDDIEEADHRLPNWWLLTLIGTIVFSFLYWFIYHTAGLRPLPAERHAAEVAALEEKRARQNPRSDEAIRLLAKDPEAVKAGEEVWRTICMACHGAQGEGSIGPNLTDRYWIHGNRPTEILRVVEEGVPDKGMPAWGAILGPERSLRSVAYVLAKVVGRDLKGKEPQGQLVE
jgi:cytochrome c oxidase cbb3-type subunit 3